MRKHPETLTPLRVLTRLDGLISEVHGRAAVVEELLDLRFGRAVERDGWESANNSFRSLNQAVNDLLARAEFLEAEMHALFAEVRREREEQR